MWHRMIEVQAWGRVGWKLHPVDRDHDFVQMPFVDWSRPIPADAGGGMRAKAIDPEADGFAADDAPLRQKILDICCAERKAMVGPNSAGDNLTGKTEALQEQHCRRNLRAATSTHIIRAEQLGNAF